MLGILLGWLFGRMRGQTVVARLQAELSAERRSGTERLAELRNTFKSLSADALKDNSEQFLQLAETRFSTLKQSAESDLEAREKAIAALVKPIEDGLKRVDGKLDEVEQARLGSYHALSEQVKAMSASNGQLQLETGNLVKALRSPVVRGRWGEIQLKRVCEMAGMLDHCDFFEQQSATTDDGRLRPDMLVRLPGEKNVIVDAKAPLAAYLEAIEAPDDATRLLRMKDHARQVRDHMVKLGQKSYWDQFQPAPEFVVMFLPGEMFFCAALEHDPAIIEFGVQQKVIVASPTTLIALLRAVAYGWRQEKIAESAEEIRKLGQDLYDRLRVLAGHLGDVGKGLTKATEAYNIAVGSFETRALAGARKFTELGAGEGKLIVDLVPVEVQTREIRAETASDS